MDQTKIIGPFNSVAESDSYENVDSFIDFFFWAMDLNRSNDCLENYEIGRIIKTLLVPSLYVGPTRLEAAMSEGLKIWRGI